MNTTVYAHIVCILLMISAASAQTEHRLYLTSGQNLVYEDQVYYSSTLSAVEITGTAHHVTLRRCTITVPSTNLRAAVTISVPNVVLEDCVITAGGSHGVYLMAMPYGGPDHGPRIPNYFRMSGGSVTGSAKWGLQCNNESNGLQPINVIFENITVSNCVGGMVVAMGRGLIVRNVHFLNDTSTGIWVGYATSEDVRLENCMIEGSSTGLLLGTGAQRLRVQGLEFVNCSYDVRTAGTNIVATDIPN